MSGNGLPDSVSVIGISVPFGCTVWEKSPDLSRAVGMVVYAMEVGVFTRRASNEKKKKKQR